jgi:serine/threonine-protein kinase HipA
VSYERVDVVEVWAWGSLVGAVAQDPDTGSYAFAYTPDWLAGGVELAPLMMPLRAAPYSFPELPVRTYFGLPALLADALPDAFGNALVNMWMAEQGVALEHITPLDRLAYAADRGMGALEFRPPARDPETDAPTAVALADLVQTARSTIMGEFVTDESARAAVQDLIRVGTSAGGARAKAVVAFNPATSQVHSAYSPHEDGFEPWLIKLDGVSAAGLDGHGGDLGESAPYGRIEFAYSVMAKEARIAMSDCRLLAEGPRRHFMTKRFDRTPDGGKLHLESLCALAHLDFNAIGAHSYDQFLLTVHSLGLGDDALAEAYRRMVFNVAAGNHDDHTKNIAFLCSPEGAWSLAPAFDLIHAYRADSVWNSRHLMAVNGKFEEISLDDLYDVGSRHDIPGYRGLVREVLAAVDRWPEFAAGAEVPEVLLAKIAGELDGFRPR